MELSKNSYFHSRI